MLTNRPYLTEQTHKKPYFYGFCVNCVSNTTVSTSSLGDGVVREVDVGSFRTFVTVVQIVGAPDRPAAAPYKVFAVVNAGAFSCRGGKDLDIRTSVDYMNASEFEGRELVQKMADKDVNVQLREALVVRIGWVLDGRDTRSGRVSTEGLAVCSNLLVSERKRAPVLRAVFGLQPCSAKLLVGEMDSRGCKIRLYLVAVRDHRKRLPVTRSHLH